MTTTMKETVKIVYRDGISWVYLIDRKRRMR